MTGEKMWKIGPNGERTELQPGEYVITPMPGPTYLRHFSKTSLGAIKWKVELDEPRRFVAEGIESTLDEARAAVEAAVQRDMDG
jgi:hypothetical protein